MANHNFAKTVDFCSAGHKLHSWLQKLLMLQVSIIGISKEFQSRMAFGKYSVTVMIKVSSSGWNIKIKWKVKFCQE